MRGMHWCALKHNVKIVLDIGSAGFKTELENLLMNCHLIGLNVGAVRPQAVACRCMTKQFEDSLDRVPSS